MFWQIEFGLNRFLPISADRVIWMLSIYYLTIFADFFGKLIKVNLKHLCSITSTSITCCVINTTAVSLFILVAYRVAEYSCNIQYIWLIAIEKESQKNPTESHGQ